jgi:hypothetical protein
VPDLIWNAAEPTDWQACSVGVSRRTVTLLRALMALKAAFGWVCVFTASIAWPHKVLKKC